VVPPISHTRDLQDIIGRFNLVLHSTHSYPLTLTMSATMSGAGVENGGLLQTSSGPFVIPKQYYGISPAQVHAWSLDLSLLFFLWASNCPRSRRNRSQDRILLEKYPHLFLSPS